MKRLMVLLLALAPFAATAADPCEGYWKSIDEQGKVTAYWKIWQEGSELKGTIIKVPGQDDATLCSACREGLRNKPIIGTVWLYGFKRDGNTWAKGKIVDSGKGDIYWASITSAENGNAIDMRGSIDRWGLAGRTQRWKKANDAELKGIVKK